jgi:methionine aminopeptidase
VVNVDVTAYTGGYHGDLNETFCVGEVRPREWGEGGLRDWRGALQWWPVAA